jgi:methylmalonyl-CoA mutase cobalamin-binding subunit
LSTPLPARRGRAAPLLIADVERITGVARATLRIGERRYGFPEPARSDSGERVYSAADVEKLRLLHELMAGGQRPGRLIALDAAQLRRMLKEAAAPPATASAAPLAPELELLRGHDALALTARLRQELGRLGLERFVIETLAPLIESVGEAWRRGVLQVYEEHLFVQVVQQLLGETTLHVSAAGSQATPRVLLATLPGEMHTLGLMMVHALCALHGCACVSLGPGVPPLELARAARELGSEIVALSFAASMNPARAAREVTVLRERLPGEVALWVGGSCSAFRRAGPEGVQVFNSLAQLRPALADYRAARG